MATLTPGELIPMLAEVIGKHDCDHKTGMVLDLAARLKALRPALDVVEFTDACLHRADPRPKADRRRVKPTATSVSTEVITLLRNGGVVVEFPDEETDDPGSPTQVHTTPLLTRNGALPGWHTHVWTDQPDRVCEVLVAGLPGRRFNRDPKPTYRGLTCVHVITDEPR